MSNLFNTPLETSLRVILLLASSMRQMELEEICALDFIASYSGEFSDSNNNLNGNNRFMYSEFATRWELIQQASKSLVLKGLVTPVVSNNGFSYEINKRGINIANELSSEYAKEYKDALCFANEYLQVNGLNKVIRTINRRAK